MAIEDDLSLSLVQENIEEYVNDENKIVTCKWLSLMLNLNINTVKRALHTFVEHQRKKGQPVNVTYFVAGLGSSKTGDVEHKCVVVPESDIDAVKSSLSVLTSFHIYSVQKARLKDYTPLYQTDVDIITQNLDQCTSQSSIKCSWVVQNVVRQPPRGPEKTSSIQTPENNRSTTANGSATVTSSVAKSTAKTTKKAEPKGSIASMFASAGQNKGADGAAKSASAKSNDKKIVSETNKAKPADKKGVLTFFNTNGVNKKTSPEINASKVVKTQAKEMQEVNMKETEESDDEPGSKRRRRIRTDLFDSSGDEDEDSESIEDLKPETFEEDRESPVLLSEDSEERKDEPINIDKEEESPKPQEGMDNGASRKRKRTMKTVMKQYQDEDGFLVSKKEVVWESESDHSEPEEVVPVDEEEKKANSSPIKQNNKPVTNHKVVPKGKKTAKKQTSPQKGKQTSMTSFFKKR